MTNLTDRVDKQRKQEQEGCRADKGQEVTEVRHVALRAKCAMCNKLQLFAILNSGLLMSSQQHWLGRC